MRPRASAGASRCLCTVSWVLLHSAASLDSDNPVCRFGLQKSQSLEQTRVSLVSQGATLAGRSNAAGGATFGHPEFLPDLLLLTPNDLFQPFC